MKDIKKLVNDAIRPQQSYLVHHISNEFSILFSVNDSCAKEMLHEAYKFCHHHCVLPCDMKVDTVARLYDARVLLLTQHLTEDSIEEFSIFFPSAFNGGDSISISIIAVGINNKNMHCIECTAAVIDGLHPSLSYDFVDRVT